MSEQQKPKRAKLTMFWSKRERDFVYKYPSRPDGHLVHYVFSVGRWNDARRAVDLSFIQELEARGYDTKTLRFSVERKPEPEGSES